jgi:hypothetical protein
MSPDADVRCCQQVATKTTNVRWCRRRCFMLMNIRRQTAQRIYAEPRSGSTFQPRDAKRRAKRAAEAAGQTNAATSAPAWSWPVVLARRMLLGPKSRALLGTAWLEKLRFDCSSPAGSFSACDQPQLDSKRRWYGGAATRLAQKNARETGHTRRAELCAVASKQRGRAAKAARYAGGERRNSTI